MPRNVVLLLLVAGLWLVTVWPLRKSVVEPLAVEEPRSDAPVITRAVAPAADPELPAVPPPAATSIAPAPREFATPELDPLLEPRGPVAERKQTYESEPRDSAASEVESTIRASFWPEDGPPGLLRSVLC